MLILSRKQGQKIVIGKDIIVTVNRIIGNRVRIGVSAPPPVPVVRGELKSEAGPELPGEERAE